MSLAASSTEPVADERPELRTAAPDGERVSLRTLLVYGAPSFAGAAMLVPILIHMPKFYSDVVLVPLGYLAIAIAVARAIDALADPFFGWLTDHSTRFGRRLPYIALWSPLCALAFFALFDPPRSLSPQAAAVWFGTMFVLYSVFHTAYGLPYWALGAELTLDYHERSKLFGVREGFSILGTICASVAPGILVGYFGFNDRQAFGWIGIVFAVLLVIACYAVVAFVRERAEFAERTSNPFAPGIRRALRNQPFRILLATYVVSSITGAIPGTLMPYYNAYVLRPTNEAGWLAILLAVYFSAAFICLPGWIFLARRVGKKGAWLASFFMGITGGAALFFLGPGDLAPAVLLVAWAGSSFGAGLFLGPAMQADVIDYDELHTGRRREAQYSAFWSMLPKLVAIPSAAVPIAILGSIGYVPNQPQTPEVVFAIKAIFALTPAAFACLAFLIALRFPISEQVHREILRGIALHREGYPAIDPLTGRTLPPPSQRVVDEQMGWFLDYFSRRELLSYLEGSATAPIRSAWRSALGALVCGVTALVFAFSQVRSLDVDPGAIPVLAVVGSGFCVALAAFHASRLPAARELARKQIPASVIEAHLNGQRH
ncbi:MAG: MFS transporter [Candidatus Binatia bacterium]|nr:MFS transporter [Candidatus Binatia bacterium]